MRDLVEELLLLLEEGEEDGQVEDSLAHAGDTLWLGPAGAGGAAFPAGAAAPGATGGEPPAGEKAPQGDGDEALWPEVWGESAVSLGTGRARAARLPSSAGGQSPAQPEAREGDGGSLYRQLLSAGQARERSRGLGGGTAVSIPSPPRRETGVEELDRAVRRDARRYDGAFPFY